MGGLSFPVSLITATLFMWLFVHEGPMIPGIAFGRNQAIAIYFAFCLKAVVGGWDGIRNGEIE